MTNMNTGAYCKTDMSFECGNSTLKWPEIPPPKKKYAQCTDSIDRYISKAASEPAIRLADIHHTDCRFRRQESDTLGSFEQLDIECRAILTRLKMILSQE